MTRGDMGSTFEPGEAPDSKNKAGAAKVVVAIA